MARCAVFVSWLLVVSFGTAAETPIDYNRTIRPILSENCFKCHGPDAKQRRSGLRLDERESSLKELKSGSRAIVPGDPDESELVRRIFADDEETMPPADSNKTLSESQKELLKTWIAQGANFDQHWAFVTPKRPPVPKVSFLNPSPPSSGERGRGEGSFSSSRLNPIYAFILARLEKEGLRPSPEADKTTLIRRVTLDLTGLPPTPQEVGAFLADTSPDAYEKLVDRLLSSPHYGERMALDWLDAARYADAHGYHIDSGRDMTRWREWVINAYNHDMPFNQFVIEQLAGDLLLNATIEQKIASGFNRNHMINYEGGAIPEEYLTAYIVDRVNTTGTVFLGLTVACAQCHDHKYDPISQKEFYQLYAFFNNLPENGLDGRVGNATPMLKLPTPNQQKKLDELATNIKLVEKTLNAPMPEVDAKQLAWERSVASESRVSWTVLDPSEIKAKAGTKLVKQADKAILAKGKSPANDTYTISARISLKETTALRLEALPDDSLPARGPGRAHNGNIVLTDVRVAVKSAKDSAPSGNVKIKTASADFSQNDYPIAAAIDDKPTTGWAVLPEVGKPHAAVFELDKTLTGNELVVTVTLDFQSQFGEHQLGKFRLSATDSKKPHQADVLPASIRNVLAVSAEKRSDAQKKELRDYYRKNVSPEVRKLNDQLAKFRKEQTDLDKQIQTTMVMEEMSAPRDTFFLVRGQYDKRGEKVKPGVPASLPPLPKDATANRLGLARWLVDPSHPLLARVIVNRYWQMLFGTGLVKTAEDFGSQGELPSHPELLDWLAVEFRESWSTKRFLRLLVTSATYRQSSKVTSEHLAKDPENRLLARAQRLRLPAEFIRDQALAASGLLNRQIGGTSVSPYQPAGLWEELAFREDNDQFSAQKYVQSHGKDLYRRTMYTFWKRTSPPPTLMTFDAPDRETCTVRRPRTNTPLQALVLMNDPTYIEASRKLAERMMTEGGRSLDERIGFAFRLLTARQPTAREIAVLRKVFEEELARFRKDNPTATKLLGVGESKRNDKLDLAELAAWTLVASTIMNLDETVTK